MTEKRLIQQGSQDFFQKSKVGCSLSWSHLFVDPTGRVKPCCRFWNNPEQPAYSIHEQNLGNFFDSYLNKLRESQLSQQSINGCRRCYEEQGQGKKSLRQRYNENPDFNVEKYIDLNEPKLRWIELAISNDCNLKCRMCDSRYSYLWFDDENSMYGKTKSSKRKTKMNIDEITPYLQDLMHIKFTGGEPLMTKDHYVLLERLVERGYAKNIFLNYSTNCTITPNQRLKDLWKNFKWVELALSLDATGAACEYIRHPAKWSDVCQVAEMFLELSNKMDLRIGLRPTVSVLNLFELPALFEWWFRLFSKYKKGSIQESWINPTHLTFPEHLRVTILPSDRKLRMSKETEDNYKDKWFYQYIQPIVNYMNSSDEYLRLFPSFVDYTRRLDQIRQEDFFQTYPYYKGLFKS